MNTTLKSGTSKDEPIPGLRDFMATSALSYLANHRAMTSNPAFVADYCYKIADAMLIEREKHVTTK